MEENENVVGLLSDIKGLLSHTKKTMNVEDLALYTGLSKRANPTFPMRPWSTDSTNPF